MCVCVCVHVCMCLSVFSVVCTHLYLCSGIRICQHHLRHKYSILFDYTDCPILQVVRLDVCTHMLSYGSVGL